MASVGFEGRIRLEVNKVHFLRIVYFQEKTGKKFYSKILDPLVFAGNYWVFVGTNWEVSDYIFARKVNE